MQMDDSAIKADVDDLKLVSERRGIVWLIGNGGSASLASHAVADFSKTAKNLGGRGVRAIAPSEMLSLQSAYSNDLSFGEGFKETLASYLTPSDMVIAISVSGRSPNLVAALELAMSMGARTSAWVGAAGIGIEAITNNLTVIPSHDYQIVENVQIAIMHWVTKRLGEN